MQALEDRTEKSRREMDLHDTIDTVRVLNARNQNIDIDKVNPHNISPPHSQIIRSAISSARITTPCRRPAFTLWCR